MDDNSGKNGLLNRVRESFKGGTRPGFLGGDDGEGAPSGSRAEKKAEERASANGAAVGSLKDAEKSASGDVPQRDDNLNSAKADEEKAGGFYSGGQNKGREFANKVQAVKDFKKGNFTGAFRKAGPVLGIFFVIFGVGAMLGLAQGSQLFSLVANLQENYNSMHTSTMARTSRWIKWQLGTVKDPVKGRIFGSQEFKITEKQQAELARQGITYDENEKVLKYTNSNGEEIKVTADNFDRVYETDPVFHERYSAGSRKWRGQFANWYGNITNGWIKNNGLTRNMTKNYKQDVAEADGDGKKVYHDLLEERTNTVDFGDEGGKVKRADLDQGVVKGKLSNIANRVSGGLTRGGAASIFANSSCAFVEIMGAFSGLVYAAQALQIMNIATLTFETVDKTKAGFGSETPFNELANLMNEKAENTNYALASEAGGGIENVKLTTSSATTTKSAMESEGIASLFSGKRANPNNPSLKSFNLTGSVKSVMGGIGGDMKTFEGCSFARIGAAIADGIGSTASIAACIGGLLAGGIPGIATCMPLIIGIIAGVIGGAVIAIGIEALVAALAPMITNMLVRDLTGIGGEDLGNATWLGGNMYQGGAHRANGGSYASASSYKSFATARQQVIADDARYERNTLSPLDASSKNTFMGSVMASLAGLANSSSVMKTVTSSNSIISSSLADLMPSAVATTSQIKADLPTEEEYMEACPYLAAVGAIGDSGCVPYSDSDLSTVDEQPGEIIDILDGLGMFSGESGDGNVVIDKDSDLAKYIRYCPGRNSMLGTPDLNIKNEITSGTSTGNSAVDGAIGGFPGIGEGLTILTEEIARANIGYISGKSCIDQGGSSTAMAYTGEGNVKLTASVGGTVAEGNNWNLAKYYQRFIEDQSLAESMGLIEKSAVSVYLDEYYKENPLDNSFEGLLARYSGLDKETVSDMLDVIAYYNYIDSYDASERYAFGAPVVDEGERVLNLENEYVMDGTSVALEGVVYADVRNRTFVI
ncbi:hypothetical protein IIW29_00045 [Candidatus Saccharibacteria bacterium]|nr:hypothetical protein [Candidatus Saccharibacteria bacterium]